MLDEYEFVVKNSKYVSINNDNIEKFINDIDDINYSHWWKNDIDLNLDEKQLILFAFIVESMNFCFWQKPKWKIKYKDEIISGSNALFYSIIREIENNNQFLNIDYLKNIDYEYFSKIFDGIEGKISLLNERYNNFREVIDFISNNDNFYNELFSINNDIDLLNYIINNFKNFDDKSLYKGKMVHFNKRVRLLVNDLYYLSPTIKKNIKNVNNLYGCADYGIPRTFRDYNILIYNDELSNFVDNEKEIPHDSEMEIEIRANMLYVIEIIKEKLLSENININSIELDNIIWLMGKKNKKSNSHHTTTTYY